tara:strand:+ start:98 stop:994 length:897 start_codon:yes stop_codon:yes gene_type:complete
MVVPVLYGGYLVATIAGRVAISVIARYAAKHGIKKAIARFGSKILKNNKVKSAINNLIKKSKTLTKTVVKGGKKFKVKYKAKTPKGKAIAKKIAQKAKGKPVKTAKGKPTKIAKGKPTKTAKGKPTKTAKGKPVKTAKGKPVKTVKGKPVKTKPFFTPPKVLGGAAVLGGLGLLISKYGGKGKFGGHPKGKKPEKIVPRPKPKSKKKGLEGGTREGYRPSPGFISVDDAKQSRQFGQTTARPSATFEARVRALVAQKDKLKNVEAGDGRSEYQVRMHKLKKENKKAWKKLFTIGGKLK